MNFREGGDALPHRIRCLGPWQGLSGGAIDRLKAHYRLQVAEQGFCGRLSALRVVLGRALILRDAEFA